MFGPDKDDEDFDEEKDYTSELWYPQDFFEGANFIVKSTKKKNSKFLTYTISEWADRGPIFEGLDEDEFDEKLDEIFEKVSELDEWLDPKRFPSDKDVYHKLACILGDDAIVDDEDEDEVEDPEMENQTPEDPTPPKKEKAKVKKSEKSEKVKKVKKKSEKDSEELSDDEYIDSLVF